MKIVIDISEETYKATCNGCMLPPDVENVVQAIKDGTPLEESYENEGGSMTREEAIEIIEFEKCHCETHLNDADKAEEFYIEMRKFIEAFDMAIKALEQMEVKN